MGSIHLLGRGRTGHPAGVVRPLAAALALGDNIICGSYDSKLVWFDLDLSTKPYKVLR